MYFKNSVSSGAKAVGNALKRAFFFSDRYPIIQATVLGIVINFIIEALSRHSFAEGVLHIVNSPLPFLFNSLIIISVLSLAAFFKKRYFFYTLFGAIFLGFGIGNCIVLANRVTPLEWADLQVVRLSIIKIYLGTFEIILAVAAIVAALAALVWFYIKCPKRMVSYFKNAVSSVVLVTVLTASLFGFRDTGILMSEHVKNLANAYKDYGFNYCFMCSMLDLGIDKPSTYDSDDVSKIVDTVINAAAQNTTVSENKSSLGDEGDTPNVIFLQLETFFDVSHLSNLRFSEDPIPNFTRLQKEYSTGYLTVPSIGAGTANTEFEVISGMSLNYFGVGEYPYKTILQKKPCESVCYDLGELGYKSHAIHNNTAVFYDRNLVFSNLGFDTFTSIEYMNDVEYTPMGWAKDNVLIGCIEDALDSTEGSDFVYTITVQSHGKYPSDYNGVLPIKVTGFEDEATNRAFEYYVNQLNEVDTFIGNLLDNLKTRDEKTVVVMYGDHLPSFDITEDDLLNGNLFQTEYIIWDNFGLEKQEGDLYSYQLTAEVLSRIGFDNGLMTKLHQNMSDSESYQKWMEILQYDMLYGNKYAYGGEDSYPHTTTDIKMGVKDITLSSVKADVDSVRVSGSNFTPFSSITVNGRAVETTLIDSETLLASGSAIKAGDRLSVAQIDEDRTTLSETKTYIVGGTEEDPIISVDSGNITDDTSWLKLPVAIAVICASLAIVAVCVTVIVLKKRKSNKQ